MTAGLEQVVVAAPGEKLTSSAGCSSPPRKDGPNPQQGMADPAAASVGGATAPTVSNTACTSPLTVTSLEAAAAAGAAAANDSNERVPVAGVPQVVLPVKPEAVPVEAMAKLGLSPITEKKHQQHHQQHHGPRYHRTPPTEHDNRKLFVGGLPTDVTDQEFLEYFQQFGQVIDSVVMVDRMSKRSRGFGFVTFASENDANSLLTAIPGKSGYVMIGGKQCEVKASTPKSDDGPARHHGHGHHGAPGMWRSNPPRTNAHGLYTNRTHQTATMKHGGAMRHQKHFYIDNEFNGDVDGRNFDELYAGQPYQMYGARAGMPSSSSSMYNQGYQGGYPVAGYAYASGPSGGSVPSSWDASYPAPSQDSGQYPTAGLGPGYYDAYAAQQFPAQYANQYGGSSVPPPMAMGTMGYASYNSGYDEGSSLPSQGVDASEGAFDPYNQSYAGSEGYNQPGNDGQYE